MSLALRLLDRLMPDLGFRAPVPQSGGTTVPQPSTPDCTRLGIGGCMPGESGRCCYCGDILEEGA